DGIRDFHVTGVQTCALPIWSYAPIVTSERGRRGTVVHAGPQSCTDGGGTPLTAGGGPAKSGRAPRSRGARPVGAPPGTRTPDPLIKSQLLEPTELAARAHGVTLQDPGRR